jgi:hypothetical protein
MTKIEEVKNAVNRTLDTWSGGTGTVGTLDNGRNHVYYNAWVGKMGTGTLDLTTNKECILEHG